MATNPESRHHLFDSKRLKRDFVILLQRDSKVPKVTFGAPKLTFESLWGTKSHLVGYSLLSQMHDFLPLGLSLPSIPTFSDTLLGFRARGRGGSSK